MLYGKANWVFDRILGLDEALPGLAGHYLRTSDERRQVISAYLSNVPRRSSNLNEEAKLLSEGKHDQILAAGYSSVPPGFRSTLSRCGSRPHARRFYRYLHALLMSRDAKDTLRVLADQPKIDLTTLRIMRNLPEAIRTPRLTMIHRDIGRARETKAMFQLMLQNGVDRDGLTEALCKAETPADLTRCWARWVEHLSFPPSPVAPTSNYRPITSAKQMKEAALSYRNCMRRYLSDVLDDDRAFGIFSADEQEVVVQLRRRDEAWFLEGVHANRNGKVLPNTARAVADFLRPHGIVEFNRERPANGRWELLREMVARWEFDHEMEVGWG